jgi:hypothetical protein
MRIGVVLQIYQICQGELELRYTKKVRILNLARILPGES